MRIALVSEHASPLAVLGGADGGGQNVHVAALADQLAEAGHDVVVYTRRDDADLPERVPMRPGVDVVHVPAGPAQAVPKDELLPWMADFGAWLTRRWHEQGPPDVVHAHFWMSGLAALQAARAQRTRVPVVQTFHALGSVKRRHQGAADTSPPGRIEAEAGIGRSVDLVIATCRDEVAELRRLGVPGANVRVVPCGVDLDHFRPLAIATSTPGPAPVSTPASTPSFGTDVCVRRTDSFQNRGGDGGGTRAAHRLLSLGRVVPRKGVDTVIEALALLTRTDAGAATDAAPAIDGAPALDIELVVAGGPAAEHLDDDPEIQRLAGIAREAGVADRVRFLGSVAHDDVPRAIHDCDVVVATPWYEPFGIVPLEAAACGRPLVGSAVGGLMDSVQDGVTGLLVRPRDPVALADALRGLLADPARLEQMGVAARRRAVERYGWTSVARQTAAAYGSVVPGHLEEVRAV